MVKLNKDTTTLLIVGGIGVGFYLAWENNFLGIRNIIDDLSGSLQETVEPTSSYEPTNAITSQSPYNPQYPSKQEYTYPYNYYPNTGGIPQETHTGYPLSLNYPYPPTGYPQTVAPQTLPGAHYQIAGTPNIRQIPGTTTIMAPPTAYMPNPTLWWDKGGIVTPGTRIALPSEINYGPYQFDSPIFSSSRYPIYGTNIDYPFLVGPVGPSPCPIGEYRATDGRCYRLSSPPPTQCTNPNYYRAADGRCYPFR